MDPRYPYPNVYPLRPAGQPASPPAPPPAPEAPPVAIGSDGRLSGINGILDQIAEAAARQVVPIIQQTVPPILRNDVLPILQRDKEMQKTIGTAAGIASAKELKPWVILIGLSLGVIAGVQVAKYVRSRR